MELNDFEKHLKSKLQHAEESVDVQALMSAISPIKVGRRKKYLAYFWLSSVLVITVATVTYMSSSSMLNSSDQLSSLEDSRLNQTTLSQENTSEDKDLNRLMIQKDDREGTSSQYEKEYIPIAYTNEVSLSSLPENGTKDVHATAVKTETDHQIVHTAINISSVVPSEHYTKSILTRKTDNMYELSAGIDQRSSGYKATIKDQSDISEDLLDGLSLISISYDTDLLSKRTLPRAVECPSFTSNPLILDFGIVMGVSNPGKKLEQKTTEFIPAYSSRSIYEKSLEGLDLELYLSVKRARWPVFFKSGVNYSRWSERHDLDENYTEVDTVQGLIAVSTSTSGDTVQYVYGDIYVERQVAVKKSIHYYLNRIDIPLSMVYEKEFGNHALQAEVGGRVNLRTFALGRIYDNNLEFTPASSPEFFRRITGLSYFGKLHYRYYIRKSNYIGVSAYYQHLPADFSSSANQVAQRYNNYGLGLFYGFRF